jgi:hypothetical protein
MEMSSASLPPMTINTIRDCKPYLGRSIRVRPPIVWAVQLCICNFCMVSWWVGYTTAPWFCTFKEGIDFVVLFNDEENF